MRSLLDLVHDGRGLLLDRAGRPARAGVADPVDHVVDTNGEPCPAATGSGLPPGPGMGYRGWGSGAYAGRWTASRQTSSLGASQALQCLGWAWLGVLVDDVGTGAAAGTVGGDDGRVGDTFAEVVEPYRRELAAHAYRMLGSSVDAEDAVQEALLAAWRALPGFQGRSSLRTWLFRITTNACLRLASKRPPRLLSPDHGPPRSDVHDLGDPVPGPVWLEPFTGAPVPQEEDLDPAAAVLRRESVELAFVAALQHLPANQRAVLLLRDVLAFSASETAEALGTSVPSANSALQRARAALARRRPERSQQAEFAALGEAARRSLVEAFVAAWERADVPALVDLLAADVQFTMPPLPAWFAGRGDVARFLAERVFATPWRLVPLEVNGQVAFACYQGDGTGYRLGAVNVLSLHDGAVTWIAGFLDPRALSALGLPGELVLPQR